MCLFHHTSLPYSAQRTDNPRGLCLEALELCLGSIHPKTPEGLGKKVEHPHDPIRRDPESGLGRRCQLYCILRFLGQQVPTMPSTRFSYGLLPPKFLPLSGRPPNTHTRTRSSLPHVHHAPADWSRVALVGVSPFVRRLFPFLLNTPKKIFHAEVTRPPLWTNYA